MRGGSRVLRGVIGWHEESEWDMRARGRVKVISGLGEYGGVHKIEWDVRMPE